MFWVLSFCRSSRLSNVYVPRSEFEQPCSTKYVARKKGQIVVLLQVISEKLAVLALMTSSLQYSSPLMKSVHSHPLKAVLASQIPKMRHFLTQGFDNTILLYRVDVQLQ